MTRARARAWTVIIQHRNADHLVKMAEQNHELSHELHLPVISR
jgi:hypothetical protein